MDGKYCDVVRMVVHVSVKSGRAAAAAPSLLDDERVVFESVSLFLFILALLRFSFAFR